MDGVIAIAVIHVAASRRVFEGLTLSKRFGCY